MKKKITLFLLIAMLSVVTAACSASDEKETATKDTNTKSES